MMKATFLGLTTPRDHLYSKNNLLRTIPMAYVIMVGGMILAVIVTSTSIMIVFHANAVWIKHHPLSNKTPLDQLWPLISGISLFMASMVAWATAFAVTWRNAHRERRMTAVDSFRRLYDAFWTPPDVSQGRRWIISSDEYGKVLKPVLEKRNNSVLNELNEDENKILDKIDNFLSVLVRIKSFSTSGELEYIPNDQRRLWRKVLHAEFWVMFSSEHRPDLYVYICKHWDELIRE